MEKGLILKTFSMIILLFLCSCGSGKKEIKLIENFLPQYEDKAKLQNVFSDKYQIEKDSLWWKNAFINYYPNSQELQNLRCELNSECNQNVNSFKNEKQSLEKSLCYANEFDYFDKITWICIGVFVFLFLLLLLVLHWEDNKAAGIFLLVMMLLCVWLIYAMSDKIRTNNQIISKNTIRIKVLQDAIDNSHKLFEQFATYSYIKNRIAKLDYQVSSVNDSISRKERQIRDSIHLDLIRALPEYIRRNSFCKKMRIIACSWENESDVPDYGYIDGEISSSGKVSGGMLGLIGGVSGSSKTTGKIKGVHNGRIYGAGYRYFHFILADNSYHMVDAKNNPEWRMAYEGLLVEYRKKCFNYNDIRVTFTPLYNQSY